MTAEISSKVKYTDLKTKKARIELIREKIETNDRWLIKGVLAIFDNQTLEEKNAKAVRQHNGVGFTGFDAEIMTSIAQQMIRRGIKQAIQDTSKPVNVVDYVSPAQVKVLRSKMKKYAGQLMRIAENKK